MHVDTLAGLRYRENIDRKKDSADAVDGGQEAAPGQTVT
jgi:hypothetical protein